MDAPLGVDQRLFIEARDEWQVSDRRYLFEAPWPAHPLEPTAIEAHRTEPGEVIDRPAPQMA